MLSTTQIVVFGLLAFVLFPIIVQQLLAGSPPTEGGPLRKYQLAEPRLDLTGNLMVLSLCLMAYAKLAQHFGLIGAAFAADLAPWVLTPFMILFFAYVALFLKALLKVHRGQPNT